MWTAAEQMWLDHFWWGVGPAHYNYRFREYRPERVQLQPDRAHNDYLNLLADWGAAGGIIVLAGMAAFAAGLWETRKHVQPRGKRFGRRGGMSNRFAFFLGASAGLLALAVHSVGGFQPAHSRQRDFGRDAAGVVDQQPAVCDGALLGEHAAARQNAGDGRAGGRRRVSGLAGMAARQ